MYRFLVLALLLPQLSFAASVVKQCRQLTNGDLELAKKCVNHSEFFELNGAFVSACTAFSEDVDLRFRCLKSGANLDILTICRQADWSLDATLSCLRSYPTPESMKACRAFSADEKEQIRCLRVGRESAQIEACTRLTKNPAQRFDCLQMDVPALEANRCGEKRDTQSRMLCLQQYVADREGDFSTYQAELRKRAGERGLASQPLAPAKPLKKKKP